MEREARTGGATRPVEKRKISSGAADTPTRHPPSVSVGRCRHGGSTHQRLLNSGQAEAVTAPARRRRPRGCVAASQQDSSYPLPRAPAETCIIITAHLQLLAEGVVDGRTSGHREHVLSGGLQLRQRHQDRRRVHPLDGEVESRVRPFRVHVHALFQAGEIGVRREPVKQKQLVPARRRIDRSQRTHAHASPFQSARLRDASAAHECGQVLGGQAGRQAGRQASSAHETLLGNAPFPVRSRPRRGGTCAVGSGKDSAAESSPSAVRGDRTSNRSRCSTQRPPSLAGIYPNLPNADTTATTVIDCPSSLSGAGSSRRRRRPRAVTAADSIERGKQSLAQFERETLLFARHSCLRDTPSFISLRWHTL
eukprot:GHVU01072163.1.p1 GENE.GHVU01072163.1~~GHVU01072163.1.p1  ORF type:complete len:366 (-),score=28.53 GHVU01072163.1:324-1421(-)